MIGFVLRSHPPKTVMVRLPCNGKDKRTGKTEPSVLVGSTDKTKTVPPHGVDVAHSGGKLPGSWVPSDNPLNEESKEVADHVYVWGKYTYAMANTPLYNDDSKVSLDHSAHSCDTGADVTSTVDLGTPVTVW